jgi:AcrR family transcriptional regulator
MRPQTGRDKLVSAAKMLLWDLGFEAMSPGKLLAASGAGHGSLYHHFKGKADLAAAALGEMEREMRAELDAVFDPALPPLERLRRYFSRDFDALKGCRLGRLANERAMLEEQLRAPVSRYFRHAEQLIANALREAVARGELACVEDTGALATALLATIQGGFVLSRIHRDPAYLRRATAGILTQLDALRSPAREPGPQADTPNQRNDA